MHVCMIATKEIGAPGSTDEIQKRIDKIAELLAVQHTKDRSKRMLISLFENFAKVKKERALYVSHAYSSARNTLAWADGYLVATAEAINLYLEKRFSVGAVTLDEIDMIVDLETLKDLFTHGTNPSQNHKTDARRSAPLPDNEAG